jgi:hypothetical protein
MQLYEFLHQGKAYSCSLMGSGASSLDTVESFEDVWKLFR